MISPFKLASVLTESAINQVNNVDVHDFGTDNLSECTADMNFMIMSEAADFHEIVVGTDEILAEAALMKSPNFEALSENVFDTLKNGAVNFFKKLAEMVKGVIEKLKAHYYKVFKKTDEWMKIMGPKIDAAMSTTGRSDFTYQAHKWDAGFITEGLVSGIGKLTDNWAKQAKEATELAGDSTNSYSALNLRYAKVRSVAKSDADGTDGKNPDTDSDVKKVADDFASKQTATENKLKEFNDKFPGEAAKIIGLSGTINTVDDIYDAIEKKAHMNDNEKVDIEIGKDPKTYKDLVTKASSYISNLEKIYKDHLKNILEIKAKIEKIGPDASFSENSTNIPSNVRQAANEYMKAVYKHVIGITSTYENVINSVRQRNIEMVNEMCKEYMGGLTAFANKYRPKAAK